MSSTLRANARAAANALRLSTGQGSIFYVDSVNGSSGNDGSEPGAAKATIAQALALCTANAGDIIACCPGHAETFASAGALTLNKAGVKLVSIGVGNQRARLTFGTLTGASVLISADNVAVLNVIGIAALDGLTGPFTVTGDNCELDIEWQDASSTVEAATVVDLDTANGAKVRLKYKGFTAGNAAVRVIRLDDCDNVDIEIDAYGVVSTAWVNMVDVASTNVKVKGTTYTSGVTSGAKNVVDTITGSTWYADIVDATAGARFTGGSGAALASDDVSAIASDLLALPRCVVKTDGAVLNGNDDIFTISGGPVLAQIYGLVTTVIGGAANGRLKETTTAPAATIDLNAGAVAIDTDAVGTVYTNEGATSVFTPSSGLGFKLIDPVTIEGTWMFLSPGTVHFNGSAAQSGVIAWYMRYVPLSPLSRVVAAA